MLPHSVTKYQNKCHLFYFKARYRNSERAHFLSKTFHKNKFVSFTVNDKTDTLIKNEDKNFRFSHCQTLMEHVRS